MKLVKCENNHLYDGDKFLVCPYCEGHTEDEIVRRMTEQRKQQEGAKPEEKVPAAAAASSAATPVQAGPVAGWLVAVSGADKGTSWPVTAGRSFIGGAADADVRLTDPSVQQQKQADVVYDPVSGGFLATPCESKQLFYLNGEVCLQPTGFKADDILRVGEVELVLVPLGGIARRKLWGGEQTDAQ